MANLKKLKHALKQAKQKHQLTAKLTELHTHADSDVVDVLPAADSNAPRDIIGIVSKFSMERLHGQENTRSKSRLFLQEHVGDKAVFTGWVDDIRITHDKQHRKYVAILIARPQIYNQYNTQAQPTSVLFDSHVWLDITHADINSDDLTISYGDYILFEGTINQYRGRVEHGIRGFKYGITKPVLVTSGYLPHNKNSSKIPIYKLIISDYPRPAFLVKFKNNRLTTVNELPEWGVDQHNRRSTNAPLTYKILHEIYHVELNDDRSIINL